MVNNIITKLRKLKEIITLWRDPRFGMIHYCGSDSLCHSSIIVIHISYYSLLLSLCFSNLFILIWLLLWFNCFIISWSLISVLLIIVLLIMWFIICVWINDYFIESLMSLITIEENNIIIGIKLMIISEVFLFIGCFWSDINTRLLVNCYSLFYLFPMLSSYAFAIPFSNLFILVLSSFPLNGGQISIKLGNYCFFFNLFNYNICFGILFIILQLKEFILCLFSMADTFIGSIYFFIISLHGFMYY